MNVYTFAVNRPDWLALQKRTFAKFLREPHALVVVNMATVEEHREAIEDTAAELGLEHVRPPVVDFGNPSLNHAAGLNFCQALLHAEHHSAFVDSDMFLCGPFSVADHLHPDIALSAHRQDRGDVIYPWGGLVFQRGARDLDWSPGQLDGEGLDTGGMVACWIRANPDARVRWLLQEKNRDLLPEQIRDEYDDAFRMEIYERRFVHYVAGTRWDGSSAELHERKSRFLERLIDGCTDHGWEMPPACP